MGGSDTTTTTTGIPEWIKPYAENFLTRSQQVSDIPYNPYGGQTVSQLNPYQTGALNATAQRAMTGSPVTNAASGELQNTLGGGYLNRPAAYNPNAGAANPFAGSNPHLQGVIDKAQGDVVRNYNLSVRPQLDAMDARSGSFGNSGVAQTMGESQRALTEQLGNISTGLRFQDYGLQGQYGESAANRQFDAGRQYAGDTNAAFQSERNRMQGAVGQAPTIAGQDYVDASQLLNAGTMLQAQDQSNLSDQYRRFQEAQQYPEQQLNVLGKGLGMNYGSTQNTTAPGSNTAANLAGAGLAGYGLYRGLGGGGTTTTSGGK